MMKTASAGFLIICLGLSGCGGDGQRSPKGAANSAPEVGSPDSAAAPHACLAPIASPDAVWPRVEAARALPEAVLLEECGLDFVLLLSGWRSPPVDLLKKIVAHESARWENLTDWVVRNLAAHQRAVTAVVAMDIISGLDIDGDAAIISRNSAKWKPLAAESPVIGEVIREALRLESLLPSLSEIHTKRCLLEVNALGFADKCTPIHPARQRIDLSWHEEVRDGLIINLELSRCRGSASCKQLEKVSREFLHLYLQTVDAMESLDADVLKEWVRERLTLPSFNQKAAT